MYRCLAATTHTISRADVEDQSILGEFQRGYNFKGRLLRPAMVKVAVKP
jgi:molecular chaperone GrpE